MAVVEKRHFLSALSRSVSAAPFVSPDAGAAGEGHPLLLASHVLCEAGTTCFALVAPCTLPHAANNQDNSGLQQRKFQERNKEELCQRILQEEHLLCATTYLLFRVLQ